MSAENLTYMMVENLHVDWEKCDVIRKRFKKQSWLLWPTVERPAKHENEESDDDEGDKYPICTKSLEMNVDAVGIMLNYVNGAFVHLDPLKKEAMNPSLCVCVWLCCTLQCGHVAKHIRTHTHTEPWEGNTCGEFFCAFKFLSDVFNA